MGILLDEDSHNDLKEIVKLGSLMIYLQVLYKRSLAATGRGSITEECRQYALASAYDTMVPLFETQVACILMLQCLLMWWTTVLYGLILLCTLVHIIIMHA